MSTTTPGDTRRRPAPRLPAAVRDHPTLAAVAAFALLVAVSLVLRTQAIDAKFWIDEGLSVGISSHGLLDIPGVLRQDGSPPLYYLLLHVWIEVFGDGEARTHALSLLFALLCIPAAFWAGGALFGRRQAWGCAIVAGFSPYLTYYAQETRMYALVALLSIVVVTTFALTFTVGTSRRALAGFVASATAIAYTHNWGLFLVAATGLAWLTLTHRAQGEARRVLRRDGLLAFGAIGVLYAPWIPSLLFQAAHTGAPWAERPNLEAIANGLGAVLGGSSDATLAGFVGIAAIVTALGGGATERQRRALLTVLSLTAGAIVLAWLSSQASPAWANRYFAVFVGPLILLLGASLTTFGRLGIAALAVLAFMGLGDARERELKSKSDAFRVARTLQDENFVSAGDTVLVTHPEQTPVMRYYLGDGLRWADALGFVKDPWIFDWRDAQDRLEAKGPVAVLREVLPDVRQGDNLILIQPIIRTSRWGAPWTKLVRRRAQQYERVMDHLPQLRRIAPVPDFTGRRLPRGVRAVVYRRTGVPATADRIPVEPWRRPA